MVTEVGPTVAFRGLGELCKRLAGFLRVSVLCVLGRSLVGWFLQTVVNSGIAFAVQFLRHHVDVWNLLVLEV